MILSPYNLYKYPIQISWDVVEVVEEYASEDPVKWAKLASNIYWRRLQLMMLREIAVELRKLNKNFLKKLSDKGIEPFL